MKRLKVYGDFNGVFGDLLCLSHNDMCKDEFGNTLILEKGMKLAAFDEDVDSQTEKLSVRLTGYKITARNGFYGLIKTEFIMNPTANINLKRQKLTISAF
jgi:hypothetical protein